MATSKLIMTLLSIDALKNKDMSCIWHTVNYPSVDFGTVGSKASIRDCFKTATQTLKSNDGSFRGIIPAARAEDATYLHKPDVIASLMILPSACAFNTSEFSAFLYVWHHDVTMCNR
jgi:hypothetical protein